MTTTTDNVVGVHHETTIIINLTSHKTETTLHHQIEIIPKEVLLLNIILVHVMIIINETLDRIVRLIDHRDHIMHAILDLDTNHALIQELTILHDILLHLDLLQDQEILGILDPALTLTQETKLIQYKLNHKTILSNLKYICITLQKWLML